MKYLLDTNICIYVIKKKPPRVLARFMQHAVGELGVSSITVGELAYGVERSRDIARNRRALRSTRHIDRCPGPGLGSDAGHQQCARVQPHPGPSGRELGPGLSLSSEHQPSRPHLCLSSADSNVRPVGISPTRGKCRCSPDSQQRRWPGVHVAEIGLVAWRAQRAWFAFSAAWLWLPAAWLRSRRPPCPLIQRTPVQQ